MELHILNVFILYMNIIYCMGVMKYCPCLLHEYLSYDYWLLILYPGIPRDTLRIEAMT